MHTALLLLPLSFFHPSADREATLRAAVAQAESVQPANPARIDDAVLDLAQFLQQRGRYRDAEPFYVQSNAINEKLYGPTSLQTAQSLLSLGALYHAELDFARAESATRQAAELFRTLKGPESLEYALATANLAAVLAGQGQNARAEPVLRRVLFVLGNQVPRQRAAIAAVDVNLGLVYLRQGEFRKAEPLLLAAAREFELLQDPALANTLAALAELSIAEKRWTEASAQIERAYRLTVAFQGDDHPWLAGILHLKAIVDNHAGDFRQAAADMQRSIELLEAAAGPESLALAAFLEDYALFLRHLGRKTEAKAGARRARAIRHSLSSP